ncbi:MAG: LCP family protein [Hamadaea sp.]|uniref:LCP family protein n=1 Tax=Hamadaea sp. TaxID=2024425 RepID=UPI00179592CD|nr:LCP family protein [Hamadaea sp.]NUR71000.1 LCP family protein [Hamadaea sp.]NUT23681.1 LCP family protein [Hamadaea sp.]
MAESRRVRKTKVKSPVWARLVVTLGLLVGLAGFGGMAMVGKYFGDLTGGIETGTTSESGAPVEKVSAGKALKGPITLLLLGIDHREGWAANDARADTIIILHISADHDQAYLISLPRDLAVPIPAWSKSGFKGSIMKINAAYEKGAQRGVGWQGGAGLTEKTIKQLAGITFNGVVVIDFSGFKNVITAMGGVHMCVEKNTWSSHYIKNSKGQPEYYSYKGEKPLPNSWIHQKGCRDMAAWEALDYSRQRYGLPNSDYDRQKHQQQLLKSMAKKATSAGVLTNPGKLSEIFKAAGSSLKMDTKGVPRDDFVFSLKSLAAADLITLKTNGGHFAECAYDIGSSCEGITQGTKDMLAAVKTDTLGDFITDNPEYLSIPAA